MMENNKEVKKTQQQEEQELKQLGFVRVAAINTIMWLSCVYDYFKINSGPLRSAVAAVEGAVTTVVTPVCDNFKGVPHYFLAFLDQKVDLACAKFDEHAPPVIKKIASHVHEAIEKTFLIAKDVGHQAQVGGPFAAARYAAKISSELMLDQSVKVWCKLDQIPPFHMVAEITVPTAAHWSEKYNKLVSDMHGKGNAVFSYVPLIPNDEIAKAFKQCKAANGGENAGQPAPAAVVSSQ